MRTNEEEGISHIEGRRPHQYPGSAGEPLPSKLRLDGQPTSAHEAQMKSKVLGGGDNEQEGMVCTRSLGGGSRKP